jgi:hypothetical protein
MMTLGCGEVRLDRVPSGQMIASPDSKPRRPSSQLTAGPSRVQACAMVGPLPPTAIADIRIENTSRRLMVMSSRNSLSPSSIVAANRSQVQGFQKPNPRRSRLLQIIPVYSVICRNFCHDGRVHLQNSSCPFKREHPERWPSGLRRTLGKRVCGKPYRGFESHSLRQQVIDIGERIVMPSIRATFPTVSDSIRANSKLRSRITPYSDD